MCPLAPSHFLHCNWWIKLELAENPDNEHNSKGTVILCGSDRCLNLFPTRSSIRKTIKKDSLSD